ncbi:AAA family ATPase [Prosthecochloris sp. CIB 2401]|uniref:AAA family ATPase n=1 Tax=Prosthecochloris sp. CIB 2401 TaxID=1868325 RepID=UPI00080AB2F2|nr:AAA family ATPase [Prosthecochloris sp. CIB 2401]ANT65976.1 putative ATP-binding protein involved in virulence [Prosthecochloris sp. CIB 2401]
MIINKIHIEKFRGFKEVDFPLGKFLTIIAGQNGTQKTTLLGMLTQPFTITDKDNPIYNEKPLCGGNYKSAFAEKFKLSDTFDVAKSHEWTLHYDENETFTIESIERGKGEGIRFWKKGDRGKGSGYLQLPVIYLSLSRLFPIGEDPDLNESTEVVLSNDEKKWFEDWYKKILILNHQQINEASHLSSKSKNTLGINTDKYDWKMNSAGQDNVGKLLLSILSFKRLKENHPDNYQGGIIAIDELDAALYPASQWKLFDALVKFASDYQIQIVATTHSLEIIKKSVELASDKRREGQIRFVFLETSNDSVIAQTELTYQQIQNRLNLTVSPNIKTAKINVFTEDVECMIFAKYLLGRNRTKHLNFVDISLGCGNLKQLCKKQVPGFRSGESLIILDGDQTAPSGNKNILALPGSVSPERELATMLNDLSDTDSFWDTMPDGYTKQFVFQNHSISDIRNDRDKAKNWFNGQKGYWGRGCSGILRKWKFDNTKSVDAFLTSFDRVLGGVNP